MYTLACYLPPECAALHVSTYKQVQTVTETIKGLLGATKIVHFDPIKVLDAHFFCATTREHEQHIYADPILRRLKHLKGSEVVSSLGTSLENSEIAWFAFT